MTITSNPFDDRLRIGVEGATCQMMEYTLGIRLEVIQQLDSSLNVAKDNRGLEWIAAFWIHSHAET